MGKVQNGRRYKEIWEAAVDKIFVCKREPKNATDQYAVTVKKNGTIIVYTAGMAKEPSDATPNNQLHFVLCTCENVLTLSIFPLMLLFTCTCTHVTQILCFFIFMVRTNYKNILQSKFPDLRYIHTHNSM